MWRLLSNRRVLGVMAVVGALVAVALWPRTIAVEVGTVLRTGLVVTLDEEGETRLHHRFTVSAPVAGRLLRTELHPGDTVLEGQTVVARIRAEVPALLDARTRAEAEAALVAAQNVLGRTRAEEHRALAALDLATTQLARGRALYEAGATTRQSLDAQVTAAALADEAFRAAQFTTAAAGAELEQARARLRPSSLADGRILSVRAPVDGVVLRLLRESESVVPAGEPLVEIGDPSHLEVVADLLSTEAVRVEPGMRVSVEGWGGNQSLGARVERVEPFAFTKVSALGIEEQRVNVVIDLDDDRAAWKAMGDGYRVEVRIVVWEADAVPTVPTSALFRDGQRWAVYVLDGGRARHTVVELGQRTATDAEVLDGVRDGQQVVLHPPDTLTDGARVTVRP